MIFGQPDKRHKQKFKTVFSKLWLHSIRSRLCFPVVLKMLTGKVKVLWLLDFRGSSDFSGGELDMEQKRIPFSPFCPKISRTENKQLSNSSSNNISYWVKQDERLLTGIFKMYIPSYYPSLAAGYTWDKSQAGLNSLSF